MPQGMQGFRFQGEETVVVKTVTTSTAGEILYNRLITPQMVRRLSVLCSAFQRIKWHECKLRIVPLNGSTTTAGYTAGVIEDPELTVPAEKSGIIEFLTALRATVVRQAWVEDKTGMQVPVSSRPEMFTQVGSDVRRFSPGRFVMAAGGPITNGTFQILLKYDVTLSVPAALISDYPQESVIRAPTTTNSTVGPNGVNMPHTGFVTVGLNEVVKLRYDLLLSTATSPTTTVGAPGSELTIVRAGSIGVFTTVNIQGIGDVLSFRLDTSQPEGVTYYVLRWTLPGAGQSYILNYVSVASSSAPFTAWVNA